MNMLTAHIITALTSIIFTTWTLMRPTTTRLKASLALVGGVLVTGGGLVIETPGHLLQVCTSGLTYLVIVGAGLAVAYRRQLRLSTQSTPNR